MEKEHSIFANEKGTVEIPRDEYDEMIRRSVLLDVILEYSSKDGSWKLTEAVETVSKILHGGGAEDA